MPRLTGTEVAAALGVHRHTITRWHQAGCPRDEDRRYDLKEVSAWMERSGRTLATGPIDPATRVDQGDATPEETSGDTDAVRMARAARELNVELKRVELDKRRRVEAEAAGELLSREEVQRGRVERVRVVRQELLGLLSRLPERMANRSAVEIRRELEDEINSMLRRFGGG